MYSVVLLDIEGTTTPISFVHEKLFPYVLTNLEHYLDEWWNDPVLQDRIQELREQAAKDVANGVTEASPIADNAEATPSTIKAQVVQCITWQMRKDRKIAALKSFQGHMWKNGFMSGELKSEVYDDVVAALESWTTGGVRVYIYSSGSVEAQRLLFGYSDKGDLLKFLSGYFDTTIGSKLESSSYVGIAKAIGCTPKEILFLSDNIKEIAAAKAAGFQTAAVERPSNAPLSDDSRRSNIVIHDFSELFHHPQLTRTGE